MTHEANPPPFSAEPINILIVDDEERNLNVLESVLTSPEYRLIRALNAERALHALLDGEFAAIVLDIQMPEMSGLELANLIKQRKRTQHIPIIFLTAYYQDDKDVLQGYGTGAVDYLTKPINPQILKSKIAVFADLFRKTRALAATNAALEMEVTQRERAETALRVLNNELEARVQARTAELMHLNEELHARGYALQESEKRFRNMADHSPMMLWVTAPDGTCTYFNRGWAEFTGQNPEEGLGRAWLKFVHPDEQAASDTLFQKASERREPFRHEYRLLRKDGEYRWALSAAAPRFDESGGFLGHIGSIIDITDRKRAEHALEQARDLALAASRSKDDFLAALSHELRTPLNPVLLLASEASTDSSLPPEIRADFETIAKSVALEARLIDDLLDLTLIARGKLALEMNVQDLHDIVAEALATVKPELEQKRLHCSLELKSQRRAVLGDPVRLQQVFWNVLKNAVKFTAPEGKIVLESRTLHSPDRIEVRISDNGIGLSETEAVRIFDAFSQGDHAGNGSGHRFGGLGLGLAISRSIVEQHKGSIRATSEGPGKGATFIIELPLAEIESRTGAPTPDTSGERLPGTGNGANEHRGRILLVEDHLPTRLALERLLTRRRYEVVSAGSLTDARVAARRGDFTLLISDIGLPDGTGYDLMKELRGRAGLRGIALSGYGMEEDLQRSSDAGFVLHLTKPVGVQALDKALQNCLGEGAPDSLVPPPAKA